MASRNWEIIMPYDYTLIAMLVGVKEESEKRFETIHYNAVDKESAAFQRAYKSWNTLHTDLYHVR